MRHQELLPALRQLYREYEPARWSTPSDLPRLCGILAEKLRREDASAWTIPIVFPEFDSAPILQSIEKILAASNSLDSDLQQLLCTEMESIRNQLFAIENQDDDAISAWSRCEYGLPKKETVETAYSILKHPLSSYTVKKTENATAVILAMQSMLDFFGLSDWSIKQVSNSSAKASVLGGKNLITVREDILLSPRDKERLVVHEIGGHVLRWVNSRRQPEPLAAFPLGAAVATEEGLAVILEEQYGHQDLATIHTYAIRVLGVNAAQRMGLVDLAFFLLRWLNAEEAAELAFRLRRGISDPNVPGGWTKDHGYLSGLLRLRKLSPDDISLLRGVKWPVETLSLLHRLNNEGRIHHPELQFK